MVGWLSSQTLPEALNMAYFPLLVMIALALCGMAGIWLIWKVARILNGIDRNVNRRDG
jgi:hypothetical protein